tara:strand:- start:1156 stop:2433 length:1278 start_codon:yes stop_codon:yes gene_type:complete
MNIRLLVFREIRFNLGGFTAGVLAIFLSLISYLIAVSINADLRINTSKKLQLMNSELNEEVTALEDGIRKSMKGLGFNIYIYPENQDLSAVYERGYGDKTMPENYVSKLANSKIININHLLPRLTEMVDWSEKDRSVLLIGVRGEVPIAYRGPNIKKPLINPVKEGSIVLGYELHHAYGLKAGDKVNFLNDEYTVSITHKRRGTVDDISLWMNLSKVQKILNKEDKINAILALECNCESIDRLGEIRNEIHEILPETKIIEKESRALARAEARNLTKFTGEKQIQNFLQSKKELIHIQGIFSFGFVIIICILCSFWISHLTISNINQRLIEIGTFTAIGFGGKKIMILILSRVLLMGLIGGMLAVLLFVITCPNVFGYDVYKNVTNNFSFIIIVLIAPLTLAVMSAWIPVLRAVLKDPVDVLRND